MSKSFRKLSTMKTPADFRAYVEELGIDLPCDDELLTGSESPLRQSIQCGNLTIGNRWAIHPMEGWDGTRDGRTSEWMTRRWQRFGQSGAKLIWGGEAMAVVPEGRANPHQLIIQEQNRDCISELRDALVAAHVERYDKADDLVIGFQLTHSGRFCRPEDQGSVQPRTAFRHPILDSRVGADSDDVVLTDDEVETLIDAYVAASVVAQKAGAHFVDIKHCHGYLLHEFLGAHTRPGRFGGSFENRTRILSTIIDRIREEAPGLEIGVRLSAFDLVPYRADPEQSSEGRPGPGIAEEFASCLPYRFGFGVNPDNPLEADLEEPRQFLKLLHDKGVHLVNLSAGSPYYNPHIQRPAIFPPSDGYQPCEDPLVGVARQLNVVRDLKKNYPDLVVVGSAYSYLQEYLPHVAQYAVRNGHVDSVGLGRVVLSYPEILEDATTKGSLERKRICRTFSDCTSAPRNGIRSGCYPLDDAYGDTPEAVEVKEIRKRILRG